VQFEAAARLNPLGRRTEIPELNSGTGTWTARNRRPNDRMLGPRIPGSRSVIGPEVTSIIDRPTGISWFMGGLVVSAVRWRSSTRRCLLFNCLGTTAMRLFNFRVQKSHDRIEPCGECDATIHSRRSRVTCHRGTPLPFRAHQRAVALKSRSGRRHSVSRRPAPPCYLLWGGQFHRSMIGVTTEAKCPCRTDRLPFRFWPPRCTSWEYAEMLRRGRPPLAVSDTRQTTH